MTGQRPPPITEKNQFQGPGFQASPLDPRMRREERSRPLGHSSPCAISARTTVGATPQTVVEGLFLSVLSRRPTAAEVEKLTAYVERQSDKKKGYAGVLWVLLNSAEFMCVR